MPQVHDPFSGSILGLPGRVARLSRIGLGIQWTTSVLDVQTAETLDQLLLHLLGGSGGEKRAHPRIAARLRVDYRADA